MTYVAPLGLEGRVMAARRGIPVSITLVRGTRNVAAVSNNVPTNNLLERVAAGDRDAFGALYDEVAAMVYGIALRVVRDPSRAEDVAQEALVDVWRKAQEFDSTLGSAKAWIATIVHRRAVDVVRSEQAARDRAFKVGVRERQAPHDAVAEEVEDREEGARVRSALDRLTDLQRQVIELAYYEGHTYKQVAADLGAPIGTIKTRIRDGLKRLADILGEANV